MDSDEITAGREAWERLKLHARKSFDDWVLIGYALRAGKRAAMEAAETKAPFGKRYQKLFGDFLRNNGFSDISKAARYQIGHCIDHLPAIERWREALPPARRVALAHPESVWLHFLHDTNSKTYRVPPSRRHVHKQAKPGDGRKISIFFTQDQIRRAGAAMREAWCNDVYKLARVALEAAIRSEQDILSLIPEPPAKIGRPPKPAAELQVHA